MIDQAIELSRANFEKTRLLMVVNTKTGSPPAFEYPHHSIITDFFSDQEYSDLLAGFRYCAGYVEGIIGEEAFLKHLARDQPGDWNGRTIVYAGPGNSPGRASNLVVPAVCEFRGLMTCCADPYALALTENKFHSFRLLRDAGIQTTDDWLFDPVLGWAQGIRPPHGLKVIAKPVNGCASIGITDESVGTFGRTMEDFIQSMAADFGEAFLVQRFVFGHEAEVPIFGLNEVVAPMTCGISLGQDRNLGTQILGYDAIFDDAYGFYDYTTEDERVAGRCREIAVLAYKTLSLSGIARIDFRIDEDGTPLATDITNIPHMTPHGAPSYAFSASGRSYSDLLATLLSIGHSRIDQSDIRPNFDGGIKR